MAGEKSLMRVVVPKLLIGGAIAIALVILARLMQFPFVFQVMFVMYAILGTTVFILLDAPSLSRLDGVKAIMALVVFYAVISGVFVAGATALPQYDPQVEKGKIDKIVKPKLASTDRGKVEELLKRSEELNAQSQALLKRLETLGGASAKAVEASVKTGEPSRAPAAVGDLVALGKEQYDLQECYNCHKIGGKGSVKKRGPILDNIGNLMKPDEMKQKILEPRSWMAEGFDKEFQKKLMPDKYKELMEDRDVDALVAYLATLKDTSVETPKPIKK